MPRRPDEYPEYTGPEFLRMNEKRARLCHKALSRTGIHIPKEDIEDYLARPAPRMPKAKGRISSFDYPALTSATIDQPIDDHSWLKAIHNGLEDEAAIEQSADRLMDEDYPESLEANQLSTYRGFCLLSALRGENEVPAMAQAAKREMIRQMVMKAGQLGLILPGSWTISVDRMKLVELLGQGRAASDRKRKDPLAEDLGRALGFDAGTSAQFAKKMYDSLDDSNALALVNYLRDNSDPQVLADRLLNSEQLEYLGHLAKRRS